MKHQRLPPFDSIDDKEFSNETQGWLGIYSRSNRLRHGRLGHGAGPHVRRTSVPLPGLAASLLIAAEINAAAPAPRRPPKEPHATEHYRPSTWDQGVGLCERACPLRSEGGAATFD
jgi:hypothetical protein